MASAWLLILLLEVPWPILNGLALYQYWMILFWRYVISFSGGLSVSWLSIPERKLFSVGAFYHQSYHLICFFRSGPGWKIQENRGPDCSPVGHPTKHCCHPQVIKGRETEGKFWGFRLRVEQRGYGPAERVGQELQDQPTCQVLGNKLVCLIMFIISFENVPLPPKNNSSSMDVLLIALSFWNCEKLIDIMVKDWLVSYALLW